MMCEAPLGHDGAAARNDSRGAASSKLDMLEPNASVDREVVDTLLALFDKGLAVDCIGQILGAAVDLFEGLIDWHRSDRYRAVTHDRFARLVNLLASGKIHHGVGTPAD